MEHAAGQPFDNELFKNPPERRQRFYTDLINIHAQLRGLQFHAAGSLMPSRPGDMSSDPVVVNAILMPINEIYTQGGYTASSAPVVSPPTSTAKFVAREYRLVWDTCLMPMQDPLEEDAKSEIFALHTLQQHTQKQHQHQHQPERFAPTHTDLRGPNILLDDEFHITAIIDWEWTVTVPVSFFTPPHLDYCLQRSASRAPFCPASLSSPSVAVLKEQWLSSDHDLIMHVAQIFQHPYRVEEDFRKLIYPHLSDRPMDDAISEFFLSPQRQAELKQRVRNSERYTRYLKENGLYKLPDLEKWVAEGRALMARLKEKDG